MKNPLFIIAILLLISGCGSANVEGTQVGINAIQLESPKVESTEDAAKNEEASPIESPHIETTPIQLAKENEITIYGNKVVNGTITEIIVKDNKKEETFAWSNVLNETYFPLLIMDDINNDQQKEIIIVLTTGYGTGISIQEVHILDKETFAEINIENALTFIKNNAISVIETVDDKVTVNLTVANKTIQKEFNKSFVTEWNDTVYFGWIIKYEVIEHKLIANLAGSISPTEYPFLVKLIYDEDLNIKDVEIEAE